MRRAVAPSPIVLRRGFTLLEIIIVVAIMAILGTLMLPRLSGNEHREFRLAVDRVGDLLTMYGQRQNLGQQITGITHDRGSNTLTLIELEASASGFSNWRRDPFVRPVKLPDFMTENDVEFYVDGDPYDPSDWPLSSEPGQQRPTIEIRLRGGDETASITLSPHGVSPIIVNAENSSGISRTAVDLDAEGRGREDW